MQQGWISLHRSLMEHWVYDDKPFCYFGAWVDLILRANHEPKKFVVGDRITVIERGQLFTSYRSLAEHWGWNVKKIKTFLSLLEQDEMITADRTKNGTLLTLVNYSVYQDSGNTKETQTKHKGNAKETRREHEGNTKETIRERNNNDNNENNENNETMKQKPIMPERFFPDNDLLEKTFADFRDMRKKIKAPMTDRAVDLMVGKIKKLDPGTAVKMLEQSIMNGWKDIYELKDDNKDPAGNRQQPRGRFTNFPQRTYTSEELAEFERRKLGY